MRTKIKEEIRYLYLTGDRQPFCAHVVNEVVHRHFEENLTDFEGRCKDIEQALYAQYGTLENIIKRSV